ncbi:MAG: tetratricopeptide repeat-containing glycosyltransferase family protein [Acidobacteria bacterium]|nr:tetratricopeptide repeat-containing glycosyltransferase family protein [Acidobacteriota bacterium]
MAARTTSHRTHAVIRRAIQLHADGQFEAAVGVYRNILKKHPRVGVCWVNLGAALRKLGRKDESLKVLRRGARICPESLDLNCSLGNALADSGDLEGALNQFRAVLARDPDHLGAAKSCGEALFRLERFDEAIAHCRRALQRHPDSPDSASLYHLLGGAFSGLRQLEPAAAALRRAVALGSAPSFYRTNLYWHALSKLGHYAEGERELRLAAAQSPKSPEVLAALGHALISQGQLDAGLRFCDAALVADRGHSIARFNRARANFLAGRYAAAWRDYSWPLLRHKLWGVPRLAGRAWQGQDLDGQSILLYGEQGHGDVIQFARYAPLVARRGAEVVFCCPPRLVSLLQRLPDVAQVVPKGRSWPRTDWVCLLMDVPGIRGDDLDSIPGACPYLPARARPDPLLPRPRAFRIGIAWAGNPDQQQDRQRSCSLADFAPLFELPGTEFVSLQVGSRAEEVRMSSWRGLVRELPAEAVPFEATADALMEIDLVITVDTAMAHLAGAVGRPVWTLLAFAPDWRWMLERNDTPWYPTMRLFRQPAPNDWTSVFHAVRRELAALAVQ